MKTFLASAAVFCGVAASGAGTAIAATPYECETYAQQYAEQQYPTGSGAVGGGLFGGILGAGIAAATGGNVGAGAAIGAGAGLVVGSASWQNAKRDAHDLAYSQCLGGAQSIYATPPGYVPPPVYAPPAYIPPPVYAPEPYYPASGPFNGVITAVSGATVYSGPGANYPALGQIFRSQLVSVASCSSGWCQVYLQSGYGFVRQGEIEQVAG